MTSAPRTRVVFVDDRREFLRLFELYVEEHPDLEIVGTASRADDLEDAVATLRPHVVVMDVSMPGKDPLEAMKAITQRFDDVRFLVFSLREDDETIQRALEAGATGYAVKEGSFDSLFRAIRKVARGELVRPGRNSSPA